MLVWRFKLLNDLDFTLFCVSLIGQDSIYSSALPSELIINEEIWSIFDSKMNAGGAISKLLKDLEIEVELSQLKEEQKSIIKLIIDICYIRWLFYQQDGFYVTLSIFLFSTT